MTVVYQELVPRACNDLVLQYHYLGRMPGAVRYCYGAICTEPYKVLACCIFSQITGRMVIPNALELTRMVKFPSYAGQLTQLVSRAVKSLRKYKEYDLLISFADTEEGHHGGIYQACSWIYHGMRDQRLDGFNINGEFIAARTCNSRYGTSSVEKLQQILEGSKVVPHYDQGKHCYWKPLTKAGVQSGLLAGLRSTYYPKPEISGSFRVEDGQRKGKIELPAYTLDPANSERGFVIGGEDVLQ